MLNKQVAQSIQYEFPYHYVMDRESMMFGRIWNFAPSYIAALSLVEEELGNLQGINSTHRHADIGCGDGALLYYLDKKKKFKESEMIGFEYDPEPLHWAKAFNPERDFVAGDIAGYRGEAFNTATLIEVMEHIPIEKLPKFMDDVARMIDDSGHIIITVPSNQKPVEHKHFQHFDLSTLENALKDNFRILAMFGFEKASLTSKIMMKALTLRKIHIDWPLINQNLVKLFSRKHESIDGCGRIFCVAQKVVK